MSNSLSAQHISTNLANYEAARTGFFSLIVNDIDNIVKASYSGDHNDAADSDKIARAQEVLKLNVVKAPVPHFSLQKLSYRRGNDVVNFAGVPEFSDGSIAVDDVVGMDTKSILMAWQGLAYNMHTRKGDRMKDYKKNCTLIEYTQDFEQIRSWTLHGCWIQNIQEGDFDKGADVKRQITATIVYDRAEMNADSSSGGAGGGVNRAVRV
jgi:hypothetical protein